MNGTIKKIKDRLGNYVFPITSTHSVYMDDGMTKVHDKLLDIDTKVNENTQDITTNVNSINTINGQLAENVQQSKNITVPYNYQGAVFSFISDDGYQRDFDVFKPLFDSKGVKATFAIITDRVATGYASAMTLSTLKQLQTEGHDIVSHSKTHSSSIWHDNLASVLDSLVETELKDSQQWLKDNGFNGYDTIVYPYGQFGSEAVRYKRLTRKYYNNGVNSGTQVYNSSPVDNMYIDRYQLNKAVTSLDAVKAKIDDTIANNGWIVFLMHGGFDTETDTTYIGGVIDYIQSKNALILPFRQALQYKGNAISTGEYTEKNKRLYIGNDGNLLVDGLMKIMSGIYTSTAGNTMDDSKTKFDLMKISTCQIGNGSADPLTGIGGTLITYRGDYNFTWQMYVTATSPTRVFYRNWVEASSSWSSWNEFAKKTDLNVLPYGVGTAIYSSSMDDPITSYSRSQMKITLIASGSQDTLTGEGGTMETFRGADDAFSFQRFISVSTCKVYYRKWNSSSSTWETWKQVTLT